MHLSFGFLRLSFAAVFLEKSVFKLEGSQSGVNIFFELRESEQG